MGVEIIDVGEHVECDLCSKSFDGLPDSGGFLFGSKGVCPDCAPRFEADIKRFGEESYIKARCPVGMSFRDWILRLRGGDNTIKIYTGADAMGRF